MPKETTKETPGAGTPEQFAARVCETGPGKKEALLRFAAAVAGSDQGGYLTPDKILARAEELTLAYLDRAAKYEE